ncbi:hypothetical protein D7V94_21470 [Parablautia intestinalis]|uniref:DNA-binding protein n=1 Tax=Parablautia intestinalis TaxID=2320100 RepID=A0A3A9A640_9FIRM|nr:hypothetical protein [Parablautia intestinalis]RKI87122.1 hypothetical protein D7V94_21470 [Parablautia intestinalis]
MAENNSTLTVAQVAAVLHRDNQTIRYLLDNKLVSWGMSFRKRGSKRKTYIIYADKFMQETGIKIVESEVSK